MARLQMNKDKVCIHMFEEDFKRITGWVLQFPDLETGGSLFGLWKSKENPVAHFVLGPGKSCKRTNVSFFQDVSYLEKVGRVLTHDYMLCHIGEWHSHHRLSLDKPSSGDVGTVVRNYPRGACGFLLIIANIVSQGAVSLSPYLFTEETCRRTFGSKYKTGEIIFIPGVSPFQELTLLSSDVLEGEEKYSPLTGTQITENRKKAEKGNEGLWRNSKMSKEKQHSLKLNNKHSSAGATSSHTPQELKTRSAGGHNSASASISRHNPENNVGMVVPRPSKHKVIPQLANINLYESPLAAGTHAQAGLKHGGNGEYGCLPTVPTSTDYQTNTITNTFTSSSTSQAQESVLQKAGLDPPGSLNHTTAGLYEQNKTRPEAAGFGSTSTYLPDNMRTNESKKTELNFGEHGGHFQLPESDPLGATDLTTASTSDSIYVKPYQWYSTPQGQKDLKLLHSLLSEVAEGEIQMTRDQYTHNLEMKFLHHGKEWIIEFSANFPKWGTKLKQKRYNIQRKMYYGETVKVISSTLLQGIAKELTDEVRYHCTKCTISGTLH